MIHYDLTPDQDPEVGGLRGSTPSLGEAEEGLAATPHPTTPGVGVGVAARWPTVRGGYYSLFFR